MYNDHWTGVGVGGDTYAVYAVITGQGWMVRSLYNDHWTMMGGTQLIKSSLDKDGEGAGGRYAVFKTTIRRVLAS